MRNRVAVLAAALAFAVVVGGLAVVASRSGGSGSGAALPKLPAAATTAGASASAFADAGGAGAARPAIATREPVTYALGSGVSRPADHAGAYRLPTVTRSEFEALGQALGVSGPVSPPERRLLISDTDHELSIDTVTGIWSLSLVRAAPVAGFATICKPCPPNASCVQSCEKPAKPEGMPTKDEAEKAARALWAKAGVDPGDAPVRVDDNAFQWFVHFVPEVQGTAVSGVEVSVAVGPHRQIESATGWLSGGAADKLGDYPLITLAEAVKRLNAMPFGPACLHTTPRCLPAERTVEPSATAGMGQAGAATSGGSAASGAATGSAAEGATSGAASSGSSDSAQANPGAANAGPATSEPATSGGAKPGTAPGALPIQPPESTIGTDTPPTTAAPVVLTITKARLGLALIDGYLVPVYLFTTATGEEAPPVPAVPDRLLQQPETSTTAAGKPVPMPAPAPAPPG